MKTLPILAILVLAATPAAAQSMDAHAMHGTMAAPATVEGQGVVKALDAKAGEITLHHAPILALQWPAMTMTFKASEAVLKTARTGQSVTFTLDPAANEVLAVKPR